MEMCRACLTTGTEMVPMYEDFLHEYNTLTNLNITMKDMHLSICSKCFKGAKFCVQFREKCRESDQTLRKILFPDAKDVDHYNEDLVIAKAEIKLEITDDTEFLETCYNYGEDYVEPTTRPTSVNECLNEEYVEVTTKPASTKCYINKDRVKPEIKSERPKKDHSCKRKYVKKASLVDSKLLCGICPEVLTKKDLTAHLDQHKKDFACRLCKETFISIPHMLGHRMGHVPKEEKMCHLCGKKSFTSEYLEFHYMRVHEMAEKDAPIQCKKCIKSYSTVSQLQKHARQHDSCKYSCDHCSKRFRSLNQIRVHMGKHATKAVYKCNLCDYTSRYHNGIYNHKLRKHTVGKAVCKTCGRLFVSQQKLDLHECKHRLPVVCPVCGLSVQAKGKHSIADHMRTHSETARYRCAQCPAAFRSRSSLRVHVDKHAGVPRHKCNVCKRAFFSQGVLIRHRRVHTGEKPYVCEFCSRGFSGKYNLKVHMKVHGIVNLIKKKNSTGEEPK